MNKLRIFRAITEIKNCLDIIEEEIGVEDE